VFIFEMGAERRDIEVLVTVRTREIWSDVILNLEIVDVQPIQLGAVMVLQRELPLGGGKARGPEI
jgi:hypothetical protein